MYACHPCIDLDLKDIAGASIKAYVPTYAHHVHFKAETDAAFIYNRCRTLLANNLACMNALHNRQAVLAVLC